ncbi:hypothetical protein FH972_006179 [Carpinus fangiana]|nr:hypothetical protein FH972_006179 [Carpinus fangiana]
MASMVTLLRRRIPHKPFLLQIRILSSSSSENQTTQRIEKILVANRGEIACRVMRTAKRLGIRTVAVYSDADRDALHVKSADEAVHIGPPPARLSYLNASSIVEAAMRTGAQAIHPGYGFLSESADFAQICEDKGLTFIGPPASAIRDMGDKRHNSLPFFFFASKRIMGAAGVPLVPGYHGKEQDIDLMKSEADKIGYPILIKPTHGGGGKGMRIVESPNEFVESFLGAQREAAASFGINTILLEKYITQPRHIEVQIFGDKHGNVLHLYERDCSVQRRHQKIIEEAPAPNISSGFRSHLGQAAVSAAKAVGYHNAGTVEFIVDTVSDQFYFMEMNTRLQVEHPVTEMIVGQDLVEWQIRVASGEPLPMSQSQVPLSGHAFEARIYAENVLKGFLPATGVLHHYRPVSVSSTVRVETGVGQADTVSMHYDPMIAKLVVWGENRAAALVKLKDCLSKFQVAGLPTNINFLQKLANHWAFENGNVETHFIERFKDDLFVSPTDSKSAKEAYDAARLGATLVAACVISREHSLLKENPPGGNRSLSIWYSSPPFRVHHCATRTMDLEWANEYDSSVSNLFALSITYKPDGNYLIKTGENWSHCMEVKAADLGNHDFRVETDAVSMDVSLAVYSKDQTKHIHIWHGSHHHHFRQKIGLELSDNDEVQDKPNFHTASHPQGTVVAPMAGLVVKLLVKDGTKVEEGQPILVLEAMKMEHVVKAPRAGCVHGLLVTAGQQVSDGSVLFSIKLEKHLGKGSLVQKKMDLSNGEGVGAVKEAAGKSNDHEGDTALKEFNSKENALGLKVNDFGSKDIFFRADKIDFKILDIQLEEHLSRVWSRDREVQTNKEEWEIDLSKLELKYLIAHGTYGTVYRGSYGDQDVAVKILDWGEDGIATAAETAALRASFQQEVAVWHKLDHLNVTKFIGASMGTSNLKMPSKSASSEGHDNSLPSRACCVVVEYLPGGTLKKFLIRNLRKKLALKVVIQIALDLSRG